MHKYSKLQMCQTLRGDMQTASVENKDPLGPRRPQRPPKIPRLENNYGGRVLLSLDSPREIHT